jgi:hypothetical protein
MSKLPADYLRESCAILDPVLNRFGFTFKFEGAGASSGGNFAFGNYLCGSRRLELHYRFSLGLVTYHFAELTLDHASYMKALLGMDGGNHYPGFSDEPLAPFEGLKFDLEHFASAFLLGDKGQFADYVEESKKIPRLP